MNRSPNDLRDRVLGCFVGGAIGDALGGAHEGRPPPIRLEENAEWRLSDDTQLTLATCEAIADSGRVDPEAIARRMASWFAGGRVTGLGAATFAALRSLAQGGHWALVGMRGDRAAGNGAAMRIAPLAFFLDPTDAADRRTIRDVCRITHHHDEAYAGGLAVVAAIRSAWTETDAIPPDLVERAIAVLPDSVVRDRLVDIRRFRVALSLAEVAAQLGTSGFVAESVPLAIYAAQGVSSGGFQGMMEGVVSLGGDTDTIASMAGQIAGASLGYGGLPGSWFERLPERENIVRIARTLADRLIGRLPLG
jgi:ADP-ribosylglycohydrolase